MGEGEAVVREAFRRWNEGLRVYDPGILDPEIEVHSTLTGQVFKGPDGVRRWAVEIDEQFVAWGISIDEIEQLSSERFVVRGTVRARGRQSGVDLDERLTWRVDLRGARIVRLENSIGWDSR